MKIEDFLRREARKQLVVIFTILFSIAIILTFSVGLHYQKKALDEQTHTLTQIIASTLLENNNELLIRNVNFFLSKNDIEKIEIIHNQTNQTIFSTGQINQSILSFCSTKHSPTGIKVYVCSSWPKSKSVIPVLGYSLIFLILSLLFFRYSRKKTEKLIQSISNQFLFSDLSGNSTDGVPIFDEVQKIIQLNQNAQQIKEQIVKNETTVSTIKQIAHDIKSPIQILEDSKFSSEPHIQEALTLIKRICSKVLVKSNMELIDRNNYFRFDFNKSLLTLIELKKQEYPDIQLNYRYHGPNIIWQDEIALNRILSNLINNSFDASISKKNIEILIDININYSNGIIVKIEDNCGGIKDELIKELGINPFTTKGNQGHGIGISSLFQFAEKTGGLVYINNKNKGLSIKLELPKTFIIKESDPIVLIENDKYIQTSWKLKNESTGIPLIIPSTWEVSQFEKLDRLTEFFIDVELGDISGVDLCYELKKLGFIRVNLSTNHEPHHFNSVSFINSIIDKNYPYQNLGTWKYLSI